MNLFYADVAARGDRPCVAIVGLRCKRVNGTMQIMVDKVEATPFHALSRGEVQTLLQVVPPKWLRHVGGIRLSAALAGRFDRPVTYDASQRRLTVRCRYLTPHRARQEILREIVAHSMGLEKMYNHLSKTEMKKVDELVNPVLDELESTAAANVAQDAVTNRARLQDTH